MLLYSKSSTIIIVVSDFRDNGAYPTGGVLHSNNSVVTIKASQLSDGTVNVTPVNMEIIHIVSVTVIVRRYAKYTVMYMHTICHAYRIIVNNIYTMHTLYWMTTNGNYCIVTASMESYAWL